MKKIQAIGIGIIVLSLLACSIGTVTAENQSEEYTVINASLSPEGGFGITSETGTLGEETGYSDHNGRLENTNDDINTLQGITNENQSEGYVVVNAALSPVEGEFVHSIPPGSVIYHSTDGITTVYTPDGEIILKARDSDAAKIPMYGGVGAVPATHVLVVPNGSFGTCEPFKFYIEDRGWITGNASKDYAPDGTLLLISLSEKRTTGEETDERLRKTGNYIEVTVRDKEQGEEYVIITAPLSPIKGDDVYHIPRGSVIYHSANGITTVYAADGKLILKASDSDATMISTSLGMVPATKVHAVPSETFCTSESIKIYTGDNGGITGNATKAYAPGGTLLLTIIGEKRMTGEKTDERSEPINFCTEDRGCIVDSYAPDGTLIATVIGEKRIAREKTDGRSGKTYIQVAAEDKEQSEEYTVINAPLSSGHTGWLEFTNETVSTLQEFTAYGGCPSSPPRGTLADIGLFNAIQDYTGWTKIIQPVVEWNSIYQKWDGFSMWGPDANGFYRRTDPKIDVDVGDEFKGELIWEEDTGCWHIWFYNLDTGYRSHLITHENVVDNTDLEILTALEVGKGYVYDYEDLPGDTTFYDMSFSYQGNPVDIDWKGWIQKDAKDDIPELNVIIDSDSNVKLLTRAPVAIPKSDHRYNNAYKYKSSSGWVYGGSAYLNGLESYDRNGYITEYKWNFGDGEVGYGEQVEHKYKTYNWVGGPSGHYEPFDVSLTVTDNEGNTNTDSIDVNVYMWSDAKGDGKVNILDGACVGKCWNEECTGNGWATDLQDEADLNNDCKVNILDAMIIGANWGHVAW